MNYNYPVIPSQQCIGNQYQLSCLLSNSTLKKLLKGKKNVPNIPLPQKILKKGLYITSANIPQNMKDKLIKNLMFSNSNFMSNKKIKKSNTPNINSKGTITYNQRVLFKKEEDEKIKKLVGIFGTRHWDLIANFIEGRTAKQCRDRYSNYLIPGFFQGEWSEEEDALLIRLYNEHGPRWSIIQKAFRNRSANNIKNRWYYFLHKNLKCSETKVVNESKFISESNCANNKIPQMIEKQQEINDTEYENDENNEMVFFQTENGIFDVINNSYSIENDWTLFNE